MQSQTRTGNGKNLVILSFTLVVVMLGFGMVIPVFPFFVQRLGAGGGALGLLVATGSLTELLFGPLWSSISDRAGRKPILMVGMLGCGLSMALFGLSTELWMLFASRALSGVLSAATLSTAMAYIGDSTGEIAVLLTTGLFVLITAFFRPAVHSLTSQRATVGQGAAMGLSNSFVSLGRVVGPIWAGAIYDLNPSYPYISGSAIVFVVFLLSLGWLRADKLKTAGEGPTPPDPGPGCSRPRSPGSSAPGGRGAPPR